MAKYFAKLLPLSIAFCFSAATPVEADSTQMTYHPDGILGRLNGWIAVRYVSVTAEKGVSVVDRSMFDVGLRLPLAERFTFEGSYTLENADSLFHHCFIGGKIYVANPLNSQSGCNPDGKTGIPILYARYGVRLADYDPKNHWNRLSLSIIMPMSTRFTLGMGWKLYQEDNPRHTDDFFGVINYYPVRYAKGREFKNPDGIEGIPSFALRGGGSAEGFFGQLEIIVPLKPSLSAGFLLRGEKIDSPDITRAILGAYISFYPGN